MTAVMAPKSQWNNMPGWGIVANLLPPELLDARKAGAVRRVVFIAASLIVVLAVLGYGYEVYRGHAASSDLAQVKSTTTSLQAQQGKYNDVVQLQSELAQIRSESASLMSGDVEFAPIVAEVRDAALPGMAISQLTLTVNATSAAGTAAASSASSSASLDTSGQQHIGTITLTGTAIRYSDISAYVDRLAVLPGLVQVYPGSSAAGPGGILFSLDITLGNKLLSHRLDPTTTKAGK